MLTGASALTSLALSQSWFSYLPAGAASQQRNAHGSPTRPTCSPGICTCSGVLPDMTYSQLQHFKMSAVCPTPRLACPQFQLSHQWNQCPSEGVPKVPLTGPLPAPGLVACSNNCVLYFLSKSLGCVSFISDFYHFAVNIQMSVY